MKTLPTSDKPALLVITTKNDSWFGQLVQIDGLSVVHMLDTDVSKNTNVLETTWYKALLFVDVVNPPSLVAIQFLNLLKCPIIVVVPVITEFVTQTTTGVKNVFNQVVELQSSWYGSMGLELNSASFLLVSGLWSQPQRIFASIPSLIPPLITASINPVGIPPTLSLVSTSMLLTYLFSVLSQPGLPRSVICESPAIQTKQVVSLISAYFHNCFQHNPPPPQVEISTQKAPLPHFSRTILPVTKQSISDYTQSLNSPAQYQEMLAETARVIQKNTLTSLVVHPDVPEVATPQTNQRTPLSPPPTLSVTTTESTTPSPSSSNPTNALLTPTLASHKNSQLELERDSENSRPTQFVDIQLQRIFTQKRVGDKTSHLNTAVATQKKLKHKTKRRTRLFWGGSILTGATLAIMFFAGIFVASTQLLAHQLDSVITQVFADNNLNLPTSLLGLARMVGVQQKVYGSLLDDPLVVQAGMLVKNQAILARYIAATAQLDRRQNELVSSLFSPTGLELSSLDAWGTLSQTQFDAWSELMSSVSGGDSSSSALFIKAEDRVQQHALSTKLTPLLADVLGVNGKRTYAILFQNSQELRPTGGFLQSLALVTFDQGKLVSSRVYSSYDIDVLLGGRVAAPKEIEELLGEKQLFFRDSNWDADYAVAAEKVRWYLNKSLNTPIDGVLALTTPSLGQLLDAVGPLSIPEFNEVVTAQNLPERLESHSEIQGLSPDQPREYSTIVLDKIVQTLPTLSSMQVAQLIQSLVRSLNDANSVFYSSQPVLQQHLVDLGWSGVVLHPSCPQPFGQSNCRVEPLYLVEANVGVNKANQYISRKAKHQIKIDEKAINHKFQITYENQAKTSAWPKGAYKSFVRLYLPPQSTFLSATINGQVIDQKNIKLSVENNQPVVGVLLEVPIRSEVDLAFDFTTPPLTTPASYIVFHQKQPGTTLPPTSIEIEYPPTLTPRSISPQANVTVGRVRFTPNANPHFMVGLSL